MLFFIQLSFFQLGIISTKNKRAEKITDLSGNLLSFVYIWCYPKKELLIFLSLCQLNFTSLKSFKSIDTVLHIFFLQLPMYYVWWEWTCTHLLSWHNFILFAGNPKLHISALQDIVCKGCKGEPSLQNSLESAIAVLKYVQALSDYFVSIVDRTAQFIEHFVHELPFQLQFKCCSCNLSI